MARKKRPEEHENHERWLISYADFITLLFAFFVVMYSVSSVNEGKYRVVSRSLIVAFGEPVKSLSPVQIGKLARSPQTKMLDERAVTSSIIPKMSLKPMPNLKNESGVISIHDNGGHDSGHLAKAVQQIKKALKTLIEKGLVTVTVYNDRTEIQIRSSVLFASGKIKLNKSAQTVVKELAQILSPIPNMVRVEGFTDNVPIKTRFYPSNWELSAARSARVVRQLEDLGLDPERLVAVGYGKYHPVASNATPDGRARNRRVVLVVLAQSNKHPDVLAPPSADPANKDQPGKVAPAVATSPATVASSQ